MATKVKCPYCGTIKSKKVEKTWWAGKLGSKLFNVVECSKCGSQYNGNKGTGLILPIIGSLVIAAILVYVVTYVLTAIAVSFV